MRILIAGGSGLIGRALEAELSANGHDVTILSRNPDRAQQHLPQTRIVQWDAQSVGEWASCIESTDAVINLAGENIGSGLWTSSKKTRIHESRRKAGRAISQAIAQAQHKPTVLVQASAIGYYGPRGAETVTETAKPGTDWMSHVAVDWESSMADVEALGVRRIIIRSGLVLSRDGGVLTRMALPFHFFVGGPLGSGRQAISWTHIADEVAAIRFLIEHDTAHGPFNLTAPKPVTNRHFSQALGKALHRPAFLPVPGFVLQTMLGEMASLLLTGQHVLPTKLTQLGFNFAYTDLNTALRHLLSSPNSTTKQTINGITKVTI